MIREKRTRKTGYNKPKSLSDKIRHCHDVSCNMIEREHRKPAITLPRTKHVTRWAPGFCKICGELDEYRRLEVSQSWRDYPEAIGGITMTDNYSFGDTLRKWEHISGMCGREVCRRSGIPYTTYQNYKSLRRDVSPSIENIKKIAKVFAISTDELLGVENADKSNAFEDQYRYNTEKFYKKLCSIINKALAGDEVTKGIMLRVCGVSDFLNNRRGKDSAGNE